MPASAIPRRHLLAGRLAAPPVGVAIGEGCLAFAGIVCHTCREICPEGAIRLELARGAAPRPILDAARCTGCGACVAACPGRAIVAGGGHG